VLSTEVDAAILEHNLNSDKIMLYLIILHWFIATTATSIQYASYQLGFIIGGLITLITLFAYAFYRGQKEFRIIIGIAFMLFSTLYIQQHLGRIEMHFHIFIAISFLTIYKDSYAVISAAITTSIHHLVFNYMQNQQMQLFGEPIYIFNYGCGYDIVLLHILFVLFESLVIFYFIKISKKRFIMLVSTQKSYKEIAENLESLVKNRTAELTKLNKIYDEAQLLTHLGNWEWDITKGSLYWSDEIYRIFGLEPQSTIPTYEKFNSYIHPDDRTYVSDNIDLALRGIAPYHVVHRIVTPQNELKHVRERGQVHYDEDGNPVRMLGTVQDITSEMNIQLDLKKSEDKFKILTENSYMGVLVHDEHIYYVNPQLSKMSGFSREELLDMDIIELFVVESLRTLKSSKRP
jgi:PAS domain-containing protein